MIEFEESGMSFSFSRDDFFYLEKSSVYKTLNSHGVASVEGVLLKEIKKKSTIVFIEAKKSTPDMSTSNNESNQDDFLSSLEDKISHSIQICYAILHGRYGNDFDKDEMGENLRQAFAMPVHIMFVLIVKEYKDDWCNQMKDALEMKLCALRKVWRMNIMVLNEEMARRYKLVK